MCVGDRENNIGPDSGIARGATGEKEEVALYSGLEICICLFERTAFGMRSWPDGGCWMEWVKEGGGGDRDDPLSPYGNYRERGIPPPSRSVCSAHPKFSEH